MLLKYFAYTTDITDWMWGDKGLSIYSQNKGEIHYSSVQLTSKINADTMKSHLPLFYQVGLES